MFFWLLRAEVIASLTTWADKKVGRKANKSINWQDKTENG